MTAISTQPFVAGQVRSRSGFRDQCPKGTFCPLGNPLRRIDEGNMFFLGGVLKQSDFFHEKMMGEMMGETVVFQIFSVMWSNIGKK